MMIGRIGERWSGISVLIAQHDNNYHHDSNQSTKQKTLKLPLGSTFIWYCAPSKKKNQVNYNFMSDLDFQHMCGTGDGKNMFRVDFPSNLPLS